MEIKTRMNKKNIAVIDNMRSLAGKEVLDSCADDKHSMLEVMRGEMGENKVVLKECIVCKYLKWEDV